MCPGPSTLPELDIEPEIEDEEQIAALSKSSAAAIRLNVHFKNNTTSNVDLIWKDYHGDEVVIRKDLKPGVAHGECTYFTHPFIARDSVTHQLRSFSHLSITSTVFEGFDFRLNSVDDVTVKICEGEVMQNYRQGM